MPLVPRGTSAGLAGEAVCERLVFMTPFDNMHVSDAMGGKPQAFAGQSPAAPHVHARNARLFLALWPDAGARDALVDYVSSCPWPETARLVSPEKFHLTLHFIGLFPEDRIEELVRTMPGGFEPFELCLNRMEVLRRGTVALVPDPVPRELLRLHRLAARCLAGVGVASSSGEFCPHLTLARRARGMHPVRSAAALQRVHWNVRSYDLVESVAGGHAYRVISRHEAAKGGG